MITKYIIEEKDFDMLAKIHRYCIKNKCCSNCIFNNGGEQCYLTIIREKTCKDTNTSYIEYKRAILKRM